MLKPVQSPEPSVTQPQTWWRTRPQYLSSFGTPSSKHISPVKTGTSLWFRRILETSVVIAPLKYRKMLTRNFSLFRSLGEADSSQGNPLVEKVTVAMGTHLWRRWQLLWKTTLGEVDSCYGNTLMVVSCHGNLLLRRMTAMGTCCWRGRWQLPWEPTSGDEGDSCHCNLLMDETVDVSCVSKSSILWQSVFWAETSTF